MSVEGEHFTDRELETKRLQLNFENGVNSILISPRRMGKTSLVKKVKSLAESAKLKIVYVDIYKCRTEYEFYEKYASAIIQATSTKMEKMVADAKEFLLGVSPKIVFSPEPITEFSLSLGINSRTNTPEEILNLPEKIAQAQHTNRGLYRRIPANRRNARLTDASEDNPQRLAAPQTHLLLSLRQQAAPNEPALL